LVAGEYEAAVQAASTALDLHPDAVGLWKIRGTASLLSEQWLDAESDLGEAIRLKPDDAAAWSDLAFVQEQLGRDDAVATLETAIRLEPLDVEKRVRLIELLIDRRQFDNALRAVDQLTAIAPDHPAAERLRATVTTELSTNQPSSSETRK